MSQRSYLDSVDCVACEKADAFSARVLVAAGIYNLLFGAWAVLFPASSLSAIGFDGSVVQSRVLWSCIGMIVGVYGLGYLLASRSPVTLWPLVLVGLIGKVLGPLGFAWGAATGQVPLQMIWVLILNDFIWWVPFVMILWQAARRTQGSDVRAEPDTPGMLKARFAASITNQGLTIADYSEQAAGALVVFVRHAGCTFCRQMIDELKDRQAEIEAAGLRPVLVHQSSDRDAAVWLDPILPEVARINDEPRILYQAVGLPRGGFWQLFGPKVFWAGIKAWRYRIGPLAGDGFQMPGVLIVRDGVIQYRQDFTHAGERTDWDAALNAANRPTSTFAETLDTGRCAANQQSQIDKEATVAAI